MVVYIKQLLLMVVAAVIYAKAATQPMQLPNCQTMCGSVDIPYPFGTTKECSLDNTFLINCNKTSSATTHVPFLPGSNFRVMNISLDGVLRVAWPIASDCYAEKGKFVNQTFHVIKMTYFPPSRTQNKLIVVGCDTAGVFAAADSGGNTSAAGCVTYCNRRIDIKDNQCSGTGCCEASIPQGHEITEVSYGSGSLLYNHSLVHGFNPCGYAFLAEYENYSFKSTDLLELGKKEFPVVLDWAIGNQTCQQAQNRSSYACKADKSTCHNSTGRSGYFCKCLDGYDGNPYFTDGCKDIYECGESNACIKGATCHNLPGSYYCKCPTGHEGDGKVNGTGCSPKDIDECMESNDCVKGATCDNFPGSYRCKCSTGYEGDGKYNGTGCSPISSTKSAEEIILIISLSVSVSLIALLVGSFYAYFALKKRKLIKLKEHFFQQNGGLLLQERIGSHRGSTETAKVFTVEELNKATNNFDESKIIGQGGQGTVYKGVLQDKRIVAIKKSKINDANQIEQFINEVDILSKMNHRNVVKLLGCCLETEVPLLVYEFIPNGTLYEHLHDENQPIKLTWKTRLRIAKETAGVLAYLHSAASTPVIHRDMKSANILLDHNLTAKVSDFGASRIVPLDHTQITTLVQGTLGYLDPEYFHTSQLTDKSDVYSFGVVLAELLTGKKAFSFARPDEDRNLALYFASSIKEGQLRDILDKNIDEANIEKLKEVADIAEMCLRVKGDERPTMKEVAMELEGIFVIEEHRWARDNVYSEENENLLKATSSIISIEDSIGGSGISSSDAYSINKISMSLIGGR